MAEIVRADESKSDVRVACALHAPRWTEREGRADDDGECATCAEIARLIATGGVPF